MKLKHKILGQETVIGTEEAIQEAMNKLLQMCPTVIITLGSKGAAIGDTLLLLL